MSGTEAERGAIGDLAPSLDEAGVGGFMHPTITTCTSSTPLTEVAELMATQQIHCVVVLEETRRGRDGEPGWGIVSDLDLVAAAAAVEDGTAGEIAASPLVTVDRDEPLARAAQLMAEHGSAHLMVVAAGEDHPVGIISTLDVARCLALRAAP